MEVCRSPSELTAKCVSALLSFTRAGQELARWILVVGGVSETVARSISAHDKEISDDYRYGFKARFLSKERLEAMSSSE